LALINSRNNKNLKLEYAQQNEIGEVVYWLNRRSKELGLTEDKHEKIFNGINEAIFIQDISNGDILEVNQQACEMYGYGKQEILKYTIEHLSSGEYPYTMEGAKDKIIAAIEGKPQVFQWEAKRKNGEIFWVEVSLRRTKLGEHDRLLAVIRDISLRKEAEAKLILLNEELEQKVEQRTRDLQFLNEELNEFAHIVSHDLKAPLRGISHLTHWIQEDLGPSISKEIKDNMELLKHRVDKMNSMIDGILAYSRATHKHGEKEQVSLNDVISDLVKFLSIPSHIKVHYKENLPVIFIHRLKLEQVLQNLISNAIKFMNKEEGRIEISYKSKNNSHHFSVTDNGPGIEEKDLEKIFQIFQTFRPSGNETSTGIGLSIVKKIVDNLNGQISVSSEIGKGSTFTIIIPIIEEENS
jgi:PAS domain S-box-containing protein